VAPSAARHRVWRFDEIGVRNVKSKCAQPLGKTTALLGLLLMCGTTQASSWQLVASDITHENYVDTTTIRVSGKIRSAWIKAVFAPSTMRDPKGSSGWVEHLVALRQYNCVNETERTVEITTYLTDGANNSTKATAAAWGPVRPDSFGKGVMDFICAWKPK
jgi:hypothetical protein